VTPRYGPFIGVNAAGCLEIDGCDAVALAHELGTPLWVVSESTIRRNYRELRDAFARVYPSTRIAYASKANPEPAVARIAKLEGALVDVVTMGHVRLVVAGGFSPGEIIFNGNNKTLAELRWALQQGVRAINVDSLDEMETIARLQPFDAEPAPVCLRLALDETRFRDDPEFAAHWRGAKFGMDEEDAFAAADLALEHPALDLQGLHNHFGWSAYGTPYDAELDLRRHSRCVDQVVELAVALHETRGLAVRDVNVGGGYRRARPEGFGPGGVSEAPSPEAYAEAVGGRLAELVGAYGLQPPDLVLEPGGYLVADAVVLLASVGATKARRDAATPRRWAFLDETSAYHFVRRLMFGFVHHVVVANKADEDPAGPVSIAGPICADDDVALDVPLPALERGDVLAVLDQGAYCEAVASDYCVVPLPATALVSHGRADLVRRRETLDEVVARYEIPSWLVEEREVATAQGKGPGEP
jgi:diaminopimelate decarboxylase